MTFKSRKSFEKKGTESVEPVLISDSQVFFRRDLDNAMPVGFRLATFDEIRLHRMRDPNFRKEIRDKALWAYKDDKKSEIVTVCYFAFSIFPMVNVYKLFVSPTNDLPLVTFAWAAYVKDGHEANAQETVVAALSKTRRASAD